MRCLLVSCVLVSAEMLLRSLAFVGGREIDGVCALNSRTPCPFFTYSLGLRILEK